MISKQEKEKEKTEYLWPENYYREFDPEARLNILNDHKDKPEYDFLMSLYESRYIKEKQGRTEKFVDTYMKAWVLMRISCTDGVNFLNKSRKSKEYKSYLLTFLQGYEKADDTEKSLIKKELTSFFINEISLCLNDKNYRSTIFGMISMKEETLNEKIVNELNNLTEIFPEKLGLKNDFSLLNECAEEAYKALF